MEKQNKQKNKRCSLEQSSTVTKNAHSARNKYRYESVRMEYDLLWRWCTFGIRSASCPLNSWGVNVWRILSHLSLRANLSSCMVRGESCLLSIRLPNASRTCCALCDWCQREYAGHVMRWISSPASVSDTPVVLCGWAGNLDQLQTGKGGMTQNKFCAIPLNFNQRCEVKSCHCAWYTITPRDQFPGYSAYGNESHPSLHASCVQNNSWW